ncbi:MAG TPA: acyltransferase [Phenylobacterium sp.]|jgi:exopolysaccharide production protein ExoZ|nr:acyltransferase [Phenylobacterium sp.]
MKIWSLQSLRFFAALAVVVFHADGAIYQATQRFGVLGRNGAVFGQAGVDVFFVLSGAIIALTSKGLTAQAFAAKRATRILPLYGAMAVLYLGMGNFAGTVGWRELVTTLTLWPALDRMTDPVVPVAWTLCFEALFYVAAAVILWRPWLVWPLLGVFASALAIRADPVTRFIGNPMILEFIMGVGLIRLPRARVGAVLIPVGVALVWLFGAKGYPPTTGALNGDMTWQRVLYLGVPAALVVWGALQVEAQKSLFTYLGDTSYALYLVHVPVVVVVVGLLSRHTDLPPDAMTITAAGLSIAAGWRVHESVEKPLLAWLRRPRRRPVLA